ncbi:MAG: hypothetical protein TH68_03140 [Candidatus Synechococcus spongiarum 142]|uniref:Autotransporter domain-containing protein n=1 Tax=Candidatus Synechococcus spongiarum 142 TaxID=1608213 RepID=A0A6N3X5U0_9SYNE|nr:MAG: hypothetical protein TH68_03140 [Candidatus Synechococcus spongiarum 142]
MTANRDIAAQDYSFTLVNTVRNRLVVSPLTVTASNVTLEAGVPQTVTVTVTGMRTGSNYTPDSQIRVTLNGDQGVDGNQPLVWIRDDQKALVKVRTTTNTEAYWTTEPDNDNELFIVGLDTTLEAHQILQVPIKVTGDGVTPGDYELKLESGKENMFLRRRQDGDYFLTIKGIAATTQTYDCAGDSINTSGQACIRYVNKRLGVHALADKYTVNVAIDGTDPQYGSTTGLQFRVANTHSIQNRDVRPLIQPSDAKTIAIVPVGSQTIVEPEPNPGAMHGYSWGQNRVDVPFDIVMDPGPSKTTVRTWYGEEVERYNITNVRICVDANQGTATWYEDFRIVQEVVALNDSFDGGLAFNRDTGCTLDSHRIDEKTTRLYLRVHGDHHDEGEEVVALKLRVDTPNPDNVSSDGAVTKWTITNDGPIPSAWLVRFGRTVAQQVVDALQGRFSAPPADGMNVTIAGERLSSATPLAENEGALSKLLGFETISSQQLVEGSSFSFAQAGAGAGEGAPVRFSIWGHGALSSFSGQDSVSLDGDVTTALVGAEWSGARWQAGAALSHSWGSGSYTGDNTGNNTVANGDISSTMTGVFPYGRYGLTPQLGIWAAAGYGWGTLSLKPGGNGTEYNPGINMTMGAVGMDGMLLDGGAEGLSLTSTADALLVKTTSEEVDGLASSEASISRFRLGLEATRPVPLANGASLIPSLEMGVRQDGGDAETGFGMELGAGLSWTDPGRGISAELKGRTLLTHADEEFREQGLAVSFAWDPSSSNRGPSLALSHTMGATAAAAMDALLQSTTMEEITGTDNSGRQQFEAKLAYGFPALNDRLTITPGLGLALSPDSRTYSLLWALAPHAQQSQAKPWEVSLEGERQENSTATSSAEHSLKLRFSTLF